MKEYKVGDTIYVKDTVTDIDYGDSTATYYGKYHGWFDNSCIIDELPADPVKPVLPKKAAEWIDIVKDGGYDITYIFTEHVMSNEVSDWLEDSDDDAEHREERGLMLINAYLYGYTVAQEKKYYVKVPHTQDGWYYKGWDGKLETIGQYGNKHRITFTESEIEHYGLQDCEKVETTNNGEEN